MFALHPLAKIQFITGLWIFFGFATGGETRLDNVVPFLVNRR